MLIYHWPKLYRNSKIKKLSKCNKKDKKKKKERPRRSACYGRRKHKSFVENKHIFWKQLTDAKSYFLE